MPLSEDAPIYRDNLLGVVGQYLLFSRGALNLGAYRGRALCIEFKPAWDAASLSAAGQQDSDQMTLFD